MENLNDMLKNWIEKMKMMDKTRKMISLDKNNYQYI
jgi:hypothetical protein